MDPLPVRENDGKRSFLDAFARSADALMAAEADTRSGLRNNISEGIPAGTFSLRVGRVLPL